MKGNVTSFITVYSSIIIEYLNNYEIIPFTLSAESLEFDLVSRITILLQGYRKTVYLIEGTELSLEKDYAYVIPWLEASGFSVTAAEGPNITIPIDDPTSPLIVIGTDFDDRTIQKIENFIIDGGRALFLVSGNTTAVYTDWKTHPVPYTNLHSMLSYWGFSIEQGLLMDIANYRITMQSSDGNSYDYINYPYGSPYFLNMFIHIRSHRDTRIGTLLAKSTERFFNRTKYHYRSCRIFSSKLYSKPFSVSDRVLRRRK